MCLRINHCPVSLVGFGASDELEPERGVLANNIAPYISTKLLQVLRSGFGIVLRCALQGPAHLGYPDWCVPSSLLDVLQGTSKGFLCSRNTVLIPVGIEVCTIYYGIFCRVYMADWLTLHVLGEG
jgi:hypothetical protein